MGKKKGKGAAKPKELSPRLTVALAGLKGDPNAATSAQGRSTSADALAHIAGGSDLYRHDAVAAGCLEPLVSMLIHGTAPEKEAAVRALKVLSTNPSVFTLRGVPYAAYDNPTAIAKADGAIPALVALLQHGTTDTQKELAAATMCNIANKAAHRAAIADAGAIAPLVQLARSGPTGASTAAAYALGSLAFGSAANRTAILDADGQRALESIMREGDDGNQRRRSIAEYSLRQVLGVGAGAGSAPAAAPG